MAVRQGAAVVICFLNETCEIFVDDGIIRVRQGAVEVGGGYHVTDGEVLHGAIRRHERRRLHHWTVYKWAMWAKRWMSAGNRRGGCKVWGVGGNIGGEHRVAGGRCMGQQGDRRLVRVGGKVLGGGERLERRGENRLRGGGQRGG